MSLAEVHGHRYEDLRWPLKGTDPAKSGLTPMTKKANGTNEENIFFDRIQWMQRRMFYNFTAAELHRLHALLPLEMEENELELTGTPLHPAFERDRWDGICDMGTHVALFPVQEGTGF